MNPFSIEKYSRYLNTSWLGSDLIYKKKVGSTNSVMKRLSMDEIGHGSVFLTDHQTEGRGQYNRAWESKKNQNLTFTIAFKPNTGHRLPLLTLCCALGMARAIDSVEVEGCAIKWPNDIMIQGKKAGGLLTESVFVGTQLERVLIGAGLNVNQTSFGTDIDRETTSIRLEKDSLQDREMILARIFSEFEHLYTRWNRVEDQLCRDINHRLIGFGEWTAVSVNGKVQDRKFKFLGINEKGECVMLNEDLNVNTFTYEQIRVFPGR